VLAGALAWAIPRAGGGKDLRAAVATERITLAMDRHDLQAVRDSLAELRSRLQTARDQQADLASDTAKSSETLTSLRKMVEKLEEDLAAAKAAAAVAAQSSSSSTSGGSSQGVQIAPPPPVVCYTVIDLKTGKKVKICPKH
jgi:predicted  nucleic acid-binding Zn-ribbon protein